MNIVKTNIGEEAGSLGAAAIAAVGCGLWKDFLKIDQIHEVQSVTEPISHHTEDYKKLQPVYEMLRNSQAEIGAALSQIVI
jgi:xylulokinase